MKKIKFLLVSVLCLTMVATSFFGGIDVKANSKDTNPQIMNTRANKAIYSLNITYVYNDGKPAAPDYSKSMEEGSSYSVDSKDLPGYTPDKAVVSGTLTADTNVTVTYFPKTVAYTVEHYKALPDGTYSNTPDEVDNLSGTVGSYTTATPKNYVGFRVDGVVEQQLLENSPALIGSSAQVVKIKYVRSDLSVNFNVNGGEYIAPIPTKYGASVDISGITPTRPGYKFEGWYYDAGLTSPVTTSTVTVGTASQASPVNLYAKWSVDGTVNYTVVYWLENANDIDYSFYKSENKQVAAETSVSTLIGNEAIKYFTYKEYKCSDTTVEGNGSTIINVYYTRNSYTLEFTINNDAATLTMNGNDYTDATTKYSFTAKYQSNIANKWPMADKFTNTNATVFFEAWTFNSTNYVSKRLTLTPQMFNEDGTTAVYKGSWITSGTNCKLHYMCESIDGNGEANKADPSDTRKFIDNPVYSQTAISSGVNWSAKDLEGFVTLQSGGADMKYQEATDVDNDGYIDVYFYYAREKANFTLFNYDNTLVTKQFYFDSSIASDYATFTTAQILPPRPASLSSAYTFAGWYENEDCNDADTSNDVRFNNNTTDKMSMTGKILYAKWDATSHNVKFVYDNGTADKTLSVVDGEKVATPTEPTKDGYVFDGWYKADGTKYDFNTKVTSDITLTAKWIKLVYTQYSTYYKFASNNADASAPTTESAIVGTNVVKMAKEIVGYVPDARYKQIDNIKANNTENITFKYSKINSDIYYKIEYINKNTGKELAPSEVKHGKISKATANAKTISGYTVDATSKTIILSKEESEASINQNVITFYYSPIEHTLTIKYVFDRETTETAALKPNDYTGTYESGQNYSVTSPTIEGYSADQGIVSGTMGSTDRTIVVTYSKTTPPVNAYALTIHYLDEDGNKLMADNVESFRAGVNYSITSPTIKGYTTSQKIVKGVMPAQATEINVVYKKDKINPSGTNGANNGMINGKKVNTGDTTNVALLIMLLSVSGMVIIRRKRLQM